MQSQFYVTISRRHLEKPVNALGRKSNLDIFGPAWFPGFLHSSSCHSVSPFPSPSFCLPKLAIYGWGGWHLIVEHLEMKAISHLFPWNTLFSFHQTQPGTEVQEHRSQVAHQAVTLPMPTLCHTHLLLSFMADTLGVLLSDCFASQHNADEIE